MQVLWVASILQTSSHAETLCRCHVGFYLIMKRLLLDQTKGVMNKGFVVSDFDDACPFPFLSILLAKTSTLLCEVQEEKKLPKKKKKKERVLVYWEVWCCNVPVSPLCLRIHMHLVCK